MTKINISLISFENKKYWTFFVWKTFEDFLVENFDLFLTGISTTRRRGACPSTTAAARATPTDLTRSSSARSRVLRHSFRCQFQQHFTSSFYICRSQKRKMILTTWLNFYAFGICGCKSDAYTCLWNWPFVSFLRSVLVWYVVCRIEKNTFKDKRSRSPVLGNEFKLGFNFMSNVWSY